MRCWYTRWQMSNALDGGDLASRLAHGHAARCASCQSFGRSLDALHADLARGAHTATRPVPLVRSARRPLLVASIVASGLALGGAAALVLALDTADPVVPIPAETPVAVAGPLGDPLARVRNAADRFSQALVKTPLDTELEALIEDGKRGLDAVLATSGLRQTP
jgi:hypothetical protein